MAWPSHRLSQPDPHMLRWPLPSERLHWSGGKYGPLLVALLLLFVAIPLLEEGFWSGRAILATYYAVIVLGVLSGTPRRSLHASALLLAAASYAANYVSESGEFEVLARISDVGGIVLLALSTVVVLWDVLRQDQVTLNTVLGGICVYFMLSGVWAFTYVLILIADGTAFTFPPDEGIPTSADALYFSLVTLTTLGYGDIVPASGLMRALASVEALFGQIFLVTFVARLVALQVRGAEAAAATAGTPTDSERVAELAEADGHPDRVDHRGSMIS